MKRTFKVIWAVSAASDLENIISYIAKDSPANAQKTLSKIKNTVSDLYHSPHRGRLIPELEEQGITLYRELVVAPWRVMYRISERNVLVLAVLDSRRNVEDVLLKRLIRL